MKVEEDTLLLIRSIGMPDFLCSSRQSMEKAFRLVDLARLNKIILFYLESLAKMHKKDEKLKKQLQKFRRQHDKTILLITQLAELFESNGVEYTFFKTIKPFPHTPNDADILFASTEDLKHAVRVLKANNWVVLDRDRYGVTLYNSSFDLNADLHLEPMVSNLLYLDKRLLFEHIVDHDINGHRVKTLDNCAEIIAIAGHIGYKEHIFTLNDFYTIVLLAEKVVQKDFSEMVDMAKNRWVVATQLKLASYLANAAFGKNSLKINNLSLCLSNVSMVDGLAFNKQMLTMPYRFPKSSVAFALIEKIMVDPLSRASLPRALKESMSTSQLHNLLSHFNRESY